MKLNNKLLMLLFFVVSFSCENEKNEPQKEVSNLISLSKDEEKLKLLGKKYFDIWTATQAVGATEKDIENYLDLLVENVGHHHYPYDNDDSRNEENKQSIRKGMLYYLAVHTEYKATLISVTVGHDVIIIKYRSSSKGIHPQTKKEISTTKNTVEVLEVENGKISMIRKYRS